MGGEIGGEGILGVLCLPSLYVRLCRIRSRRVSVVVVIVVIVVVACIEMGEWQFFLQQGCKLAKFQKRR